MYNVSSKKEVIEILKQNGYKYKATHELFLKDNGDGEMFTIFHLSTCNHYWLKYMKGIVFKSLGKELHKIFMSLYPNEKIYNYFDYTPLYFNSYDFLKLERDKKVDTSKFLFNVFLTEKNLFELALEKAFDNSLVYDDINIALKENEKFMPCYYPSCYMKILYYFKNDETNRALKYIEKLLTISSSEDFSESLIKFREVLILKYGITS